MVVKFHKLLIICFLIIYGDLLCYKDTSVFATKEAVKKIRTAFFIKIKQQDSSTICETRVQFLSSLTRLQNSSSILSNFYILKNIKTKKPSIVISYIGLISATIIISINTRLQYQKPYLKFN